MSGAKFVVTKRDGTYLQGNFPTGESAIDFAKSYGRQAKAYELHSENGLFVWESLKSGSDIKRQSKRITPDKPQGKSGKPQPDLGEPQNIQIDLDGKPYIQGSDGKRVYDLSGKEQKEVLNQKSINGTRYALMRRTRDFMGQKVTRYSVVWNYDPKTGKGSYSSETGSLSDAGATFDNCGKEW